VEQVPRAFSCLLDVPVWKTQLDMQKHVGLSSVRKWTIVIVNSSVDSEMEIKHSDHKYPPWQSRDVDEHGMPLPLQPKDLGHDGK